MAEYKVPQDVEADDKLIGPFSFRQFIYLIICAALIGLAVILFNILPPLCVIPIPFVLALLVFALPLKKDQPMETYVAAIIMYHLKPNVRLWTPGQPETIVDISAPKKVEEDRTNGLTQDEASHRLSFLADLIDTEGYAIKGGSPNNALHDDIYAEAQETQDIFDTPQNSQLDQALIASANAHQQQIADSMRRAIHNAGIGQTDNSQTFTAPSYYEAPENFTASDTSLEAAGKIDEYVAPAEEKVIVEEQPSAQSSVIVSADMPVDAVSVPEPTNPYALSIDQVETPTEPNDKTPQDAATTAREAVQNALREAGAGVNVEEQAELDQSQSSAQPQLPDPEFVDLANNTDFSIETIAQQANRIKDNSQSNNGEVYISLH